MYISKIALAYGGIGLTGWQFSWFELKLPVAPSSSW